ncbi:ImmA/IrrE family metallo-endopeptidase [Gracilibacillus lacisalsi]|uniref:ImmA/IrrE family metallo-endopeptidase n=1 Tax=Gracilibacillus lacisalsi TaxID=393087 RepID=UPI00037EFC9E|nr:ImmA/IrrE family metallo-endopeptidase [Gracilibacillus lacisalsi]
MMRTKPDYNKAKRCAYKALEEHNVNDFPIDILTILNSYDDIKIIKYSEMAKQHGCSIEEIISLNSSEDGVIHYSGKRDKYIIAYNDTIEVKERVYWTLAHEFGHYILGHHKESERYSLSRNEISEDEYNIHEVEANFFSRFFISPPAIIVEANMHDHNKIMEFFGISFTAAINTLKYIQNSYNKGFRFFLPETLSNRFKTFIRKVVYGRTCSNCSAFSFRSNLHHCGICGSNDFHNFMKGEDIDMIYPGVEVNQEGKAIVCPVCSNEETNIEGDYCTQCGTYIVNKCSVTDVDWNDNEYHTCPDPLPGNIRYCPSCGSKTTFLENGILSEWNEVINGNVKKPQLSAVPDLSDDDLPF